MFSLPDRINLLNGFFVLIGSRGCDCLQISRQMFTKSSSAKSSRLVCVTVVVFGVEVEEVSLNAAASVSFAILDLKSS